MNGNQVPSRSQRPSLTLFGDRLSAFCARFGGSVEGAKSVRFLWALLACLSLGLMGDLRAAPAGSGVAEEAELSDLLPILAPASRGRDDLPEVFQTGKLASVDAIKKAQDEIVALVDKVLPATVAVRVGGATGSGVVISPDGLVLTAAHVAGEPDREVVFTFPDGSNARGVTLGTDHRRDAGLMRITEEGVWPYVEPGDTAWARAGDWVLAIGHPGGFVAERPPVVRLGRIIDASGRLIQTDCTITAGDSGGPLIDMNGQVIGIHSRISESTVSNYHVPLSRYRETWERLAQGENWGFERGRFRRPVFGVRSVDHPGGCMVESVFEGSPADEAGLKAGDLLVRVNDVDIDGQDAFLSAIRRGDPGDELKVVFRRDGEERSATVTLRPWGRGRR